jgi:thioredoxin-related protein
MRFFSLIFFQIVLLSGIAAQGGVKFSKGAWEELLSRAKAQKALIFMDAYAEWCGPCKLMTLNVFPQQEVGDFYNANFINVKMDMEQGEGVSLAAKYNVAAYPTLLFINGDGALVHRVAGYHSPEQLLELGKKALDPSRTLSGMEARYNAGERNPEFLYEYVLARYEAMDDSHRKVANEYFRVQTDWSSPENMQLLFLLVEDTDSPQFDYLVENRKDFDQMFGQQAVIARIQQLILQKVSSGGSRPALEEIDALFAKAYPEMAAKLSANFRMDYYEYVGDMRKYAQTAVQYLEKYPSKDPEELNNIAWSFYEYVDDKEYLQKALGWAEQSVKMDNQYYNNDTLAALHYKLGKKRKALKIATHAISIAKANGEDYSSTLELLEKMKS